jgi:hypothetical protein
MTAFFIVEDKKPTREALADLLRLNFPGARISMAGNLTEAMGLARETSDRGEYFDVAFLDMRLPRDMHESGEGNVYPELRRELLAALTYRTAVINHSGYAAQSEVQQAAAEMREPNAAGPPVLIDASPGQDWDQEILHHARRIVYGRRIAGRLDPMLHAARSAVPREVLQRANPGGGGTQELAALIRDIKVAWDDLDDELKRRIQTAFDVRKVDGSVLVNL